MLLTNENYFSKEANQKYLSVSQYKNFVGTLGIVNCEAKAMAELNEEWKFNDKTTPLLVGSYVDAHFEETLATFKAQNPEIFTQKGELRAAYKQAEEIISRVERDEYFMKFMSGKKQVIMTANLFGVDFKIKIDSLLEDIAIVDLKVMQSLTKVFWTRDFGYMDFIQYWGYDIQGAIYQEVVYQNTGKRLPFYIAGVSKEKPEPNLEIIHIDDQHLKEKLIEVEQNTPKIMMLKKGEVEPIRCEMCDYCKHTKTLTKPIHFSELLGEV